MSVLLFLIGVGVVVLWVRRRRHNKAVLGGLTAERPTFTVEPPARRVSARKHEAL